MHGADKFIGALIVNIHHSNEFFGWYTGLESRPTYRVEGSCKLYLSSHGVLFYIYIYELELPDYRAAEWKTKSGKLNVNMALLPCFKVDYSKIFTIEQQEWLHPNLQYMFKFSWHLYDFLTN